MSRKSRLPSKNSMFPALHLWGLLLIICSTTLAGATTSIETVVYQTSTSLCPVTEVSTISGKEVTVVYTSTSLIVVQVPTTIVEYTTELTTCYETTEVYTTESVSSFDSSYSLILLMNSVDLRDLLHHSQRWLDDRAHTNAYQHD